MNEITDELLARYMANAGDLSEDERKIAEQWAKENKNIVDLYSETMQMQAQQNHEIGLFNDRTLTQTTIPLHTQRPTHRYRVAASIAAIVTVSIVLSILFLPSKNNGTMQAGMGKNAQTPWHSTEKIPNEWVVSNGDLVIEWESNAPHTRLDISFDGDSWSTYVEDKNKCIIKYDSTFCKDTIYWYLTFTYDNQQKTNSSGKIIINIP